MERLTTDFLVLALAGCKDQGPRISTIDGKWDGTIEGAVVILTLAENERDVSGSGSIRIGTESIALTAEGTHSYPSVSLNIQAQGFEDMNYTGEFDEDDEHRIEGSLNGSGFNDDPLNLLREK